MFNWEMQWSWEKSKRHTTGWHRLCFSNLCLEGFMDNVNVLLKFYLCIFHDFFSLIKIWAFEAVYYSFCRLVCCFWILFYFSYILELENSAVYALILLSHCFHDSKGTHILSGNVFEPRALDELLPQRKQEEVLVLFLVSISYYVGWTL